MKFTFEVEENDTISFLDIKITSENNSFLLQFIASLHLVTFLLILKVSPPLSFSLSVYLLCGYKTFFIFITIDYRRYFLVLAFDFFTSISLFFSAFSLVTIDHYNALYVWIQTFLGNFSSSDGLWGSDF